MQALVQVILQGRLPAALITAAVFLVSVFLPFLGGILVLVAAVPAAVIGWHMGGRQVTEVGLLAALVIGLATQQLVAPALWLAALWAPVAGGALILRSGPYFPWLALGSGGLALVGLGGWIVSLGGDPGSVVQNWVGEVLRGWIQSQDLPQEEAQRAIQDLEAQVVPSLAQFLPGIIASGVVVAWWVNLLGGLRLAAAAGPMPDLAPVLRAFRLPDTAVWVTIALGLVAWLGAANAGGYWAANALVVVALLFLAQGLAVIHSARLAFGIGGGWLVVFYILLALFVQLMLAVALLGLADIWADFRNKLKTGEG